MKLNKMSFLNEKIKDVVASRKAARRSRVFPNLWIYLFGARKLRNFITASSLTLLAKTENAMIAKKKIGASRK